MVMIKFIFEKDKHQSGERSKRVWKEQKRILIFYTVVKVAVLLVETPALTTAADRSFPCLCI